MSKIRLIFVLPPLFIVLCLGLILTETSLAEESATMKAIKQIPPSWSQILPADDRFELVLNDEAVLDKETGLVWEKSPNTTLRDWFEASSFCYPREVGGRKGWRLPAIEELASLVDTSQSNLAFPAGHPFTNVQSAFYWSSSTYASLASNALDVYFGEGFVGYNGKSYKDYVWCVRGGYGHDAY